MSITNIRAQFQCEMCGGLFHVDLDTATETWDGLSLMDYAEDAVAEGAVREQSGFSSMYKGDTICAHCTKDVDEKLDLATPEP